MRQILLDQPTGRKRQAVPPPVRKVALASTSLGGGFVCVCVAVEPPESELNDARS